MNPFTAYKRARTLKNTSSRHKNENWYLDAVELKEQLHYVVTSDHQIQLFHLDVASQAWTLIASYSKADLVDEEQHHAHIEAVMAEVAIDPEVGMGVILHQTNDFILREGRHKYDDLDIEQINDLLTSVPEDVLDDPKAQESALIRRAYPLSPQAKEQGGYLVGNVKDDYTLFLQAWREYGNAQNLPVTTQLFASPPCILTYLKRLVADSTGEKTIGVLVIGKQISYIAFFDSEEKPLFYRALHHFGGSLPNQLPKTIQNTAVQMQVEEYDLYYAFASDDRSANEQLKLKFELSSEQIVPEEIEWNAREMKRVELAAMSHHQFTQDLPDSLLQSFIDYEEQELAQFPTQQEMKILNYSDTVKKVAWGLTGLVAVLQCFFIYRMVSQSEWKFNPQEITILNATISHYNTVKRAMVREESLLEDRSKSWETLEFLVRAFPFSQGFMVTDYRYNTVPIQSAKIAKTGLVRTWEISGYAQSSAEERLNELRSADQVRQIFRDMEVKSYIPDGDSRNLIVNLEVSTSNSSPSHPLRFRAVVTQRIEPSDPLALHIK